MPEIWVAIGLEIYDSDASVEMCSATLFMGADPALVVSNSIFGDGAAAVALQNGEGDTTGGLARVLDFASGVYPQWPSASCRRP